MGRQDERDRVGVTVVDDSTLIKEATAYLYYVLQTDAIDGLEKDRWEKAGLALAIWQTGMNHPED